MNATTANALELRLHAHETREQKLVLGLELALRRQRVAQTAARVRNGLRAVELLVATMVSLDVDSPAERTPDYHTQGKLDVFLKRLRHSVASKTKTKKLNTCTLSCTVSCFRV